MQAQHPKHMPVRLDARGVPVTTQSSEAVALLEHAILGLAGHRADTASWLDKTLALDPGVIPALCMRAFAYKALGRSDLEAAAREHVRAAQSSLADRGGSARERMLCAALTAWCEGQPLTAAATLESALTEYPRDLLTFKLCHALNFILGRPLPMRKAVEQALPAWNEAVPGCGFVLGCYAFALEETGELALAEQQGRRAVALEPLDAWGAHAVTHVFESTDRPEAGLAWMDDVEPALAGCNNFAGHLAWHRALLLLQRGELDRALALHDEQIAVHLGRDYRDVANASTLLWRLEREGMNVGARWERLVELARARIGDHGLAFADAHYALALASAQQLTAAQDFVRSMRTAAETRRGFYADVAAEIGVPLAEGIVALGAGSPLSAVEKLLPIAPAFQRLGGSHAQRDIFRQLLIEAALQCDGRLARVLLEHRLAVRPGNRYARQQLSRLHSAKAAA